MDCPPLLLISFMHSTSSIPTIPPLLAALFGLNNVRQGAAANGIQRLERLERWTAAALPLHVTPIPTARENSLADQNICSVEIS